LTVIVLASSLQKLWYITDSIIGKFGIMSLSFTAANVVVASQELQVTQQLIAQDQIL